MRNIKALFGVLFLGFTLPLASNCSNANPLSYDVVPGHHDLEKLNLKELVDQYYPNFYLGIANHARLAGQESMAIMDKEFGYVTPSNDFKQSYIHPTFNSWRWENADFWIKYSKENNLILRIHGPISLQSSKWVKEDNRTAAQLSKMLDEYMTALCLRYGNEPRVKWMDVVNEVIAVQKVKDPIANYNVGDWFGPRQGVDKWENPWPIMGYDSESELNVPLYIDRAFEISNRYAPNIKQIINQHGDFEDIVWEKMKKLVSYLRNDKHRKVDGLGWQAHIDTGWEKEPGNLERLDSFIKWCHANELEFHITEMNVWLKDGDRSREDQQADTYQAVLEILLNNRSSGVVGLNFWNVKDQDVPNPKWLGTLWNEDGTAKKAYDRIKQTLITNIRK